MKRKILLITGCVLMAIQAMAQSGNKKDVPAKEKRPTINNELINKPILPDGNGVKWPLPYHQEQRASFDSVATSRSSIQFKPSYDGYNGTFPSYKKIFLHLEGEQQQYPDFASYYLAYVALGWRLNRKLNLTGGLLAIKQFTNHTPYGTDRPGARFDLRYSITDQLYLYVWGQQLASSSLYSSASLLLPQTGTGASMILNLGSGSQFSVGTEYRYDQQKDKWNYQSGGKLKLNF